jgi:hypothetical protein
MSLAALTKSMPKKSEEKKTSKKKKKKNGKERKEKKRLPWRNVDNNQNTESYISVFCLFRP